MERDQQAQPPSATSGAWSPGRGPPGPRDATDLILRLARVQQGVVGRGQLLDSGLGQRQVDLRVSRGLLVPIARGVYGVGHDVVSRRGRWRAGLLSAGPGAALSHWSAAAVWGVVGPRDRVEVIRPHSRKVPSNHHFTSRSSRSWIIVHRSRKLDQADFTVRDGFPVTAFTRTMIDLAARLDEDRIRSMLREGERLRVADWSELRRETASGRGRKGIARLRAVVTEWTGADSATRSDLELRFLSLCRRAGLPLPIVNGSVSGFEVDCTWPGSRLAVELDGYETHRDRSSFESDRLRDLVLKRDGLHVLRVTDRMLKYRPGEVAAFLKDRLAVPI